MKHILKQNAGLTLIELVVAIAMATVVTAAATSVLLLGLRVNRQTADTSTQQITVQALLNVMEDAAADGKIKEIVTDYVEESEEGNTTKYGSWKLIDTSDSEIFSYDADTQTISTNGTAVLEGVYASNAIMEGQLLSISIETEDGTYTSAIYCRTASFVEEPDLNELPNDPSVLDAARNKFLEILKSQYRSRGEIKNGDGQYTYYSEWYIDADYGDTIPDNGWNSRTPWCACYVSWALVQSESLGPAGHEKWFANVDYFMSYFQKSDTWEYSKANGGTYAPVPGDLIFFDWNKGENPQHVGVVLKVEGPMVYTIEGNSAGRVTVRSYSLGDPRIIGYGVIFRT